MDTAIKHLVPDLVIPSLVIFDIRALWRSGLSVRVPRKNYKWRHNQVWHKMLDSCTQIATVGVKGLKVEMSRDQSGHNCMYTGHLLLV